MPEPFFACVALMLSMISSVHSPTYSWNLQVLTSEIPRWFSSSVATIFIVALGNPMDLGFKPGARRLVGFLPNLSNRYSHLRVSALGLPPRALQDARIAGSDKIVRNRTQNPRAVARKRTSSSKSGAAAGRAIVVDQAGIRRR
ncbi:hypothetical protein F3P66_26260 (plasmid) [Agrobacterium fabrum]|uniref:Uncharacterized protein n=2 Tax=Agrobacterium fabrum TaxID=1176649 RepID=Q8U5Z1_AGRFC|nr:hypothetical protein Atu6163 [Agrobacterium fabrum str. C58]ASK43366.1 hypothetical protein [Agrobacterium fabrum]QRM62870.1 hypothetical protein F3P66_26260 [Agrobacterium fabrum]